MLIMAPCDSALHMALDACNRSRSFPLLPWQRRYASARRRRRRRHHPTKPLLLVRRTQRWTRLPPILQRVAGQASRLDDLVGELG